MSIRTVRSFIVSLSWLLVGCASSLPPVGAPPAELLAPTLVAWRSSPAIPGDASRITDLSLGGGVHCARTISGRALCVGSATASLTRVVDDIQRRVLSLSAGGQHACALLDDHTVRCIGNNTLAQLGAPPTSDALSWTQPAVTDVIAVVAGDQHTCALDAQRRVWCWGFNMHGSAGAPARSERCIGSSDECTCSSVPTLIEGVSDVESVHAAGASSCAVTGDRRVFCWGFNQAGQLGNHATKPRSSPVEAVDARGLRMLALGSSHACALMPSGRVSCWGSALQHRLARDAERWCTIPMLDGPPSPCDPFAGEIPGLDRVVSIATRDALTCALRDDHSVWCWGVRHGRELAPYAWRAMGVHRVDAFDGATELRVGGRIICARSDRFDWRCVGASFTGQRPSDEGSIAARPLRLTEEGSR